MHAKLSEKSIERLIESIGESGREKERGSDLIRTMEWKMHNYVSGT